MGSQAAGWSGAVPRLRDEVMGVKLGDQRLSRRLEKIVEVLGTRPHESIPSACVSRADTVRVCGR